MEKKKKKIRKQLFKIFVIIVMHKELANKNLHFRIIQKKGIHYIFKEERVVYPLKIKALIKLYKLNLTSIIWEESLSMSLLSFLVNQLNFNKGVYCNKFNLLKNFIRINTLKNCSNKLVIRGKTLIILEHLLRKEF